MTLRKMEPQRRVYICLPKKYMASLSEKWELDHGLIIKDLSTHINEGYLQTYFRQWGTITECTIHRIQPSDSKTATAMGYVRFSSEDEADEADWAGPHYIGGLDVVVKRIVAPKMNEPKRSDGAEFTPARPTPS
ncbi:heterogeneous nuclear ribonucleoprotein A2 homolog 1-like [Esox lucius]|uniref:Heterogeneous nuclear ribonucleoprotein A2 homolog 1 n=1 Tax=Esox lucius TaxID=8010 RepID=C1BYZ7_ESOLU|nr:heterogeneous nuclear ribonucleoprotein A2 homolog 1-like [Esox lucius]ACO14250.1 Heterogeneous nuclear ribonucleoprotein A2 homolog 1 [Esox lucius]